MDVFSRISSLDEEMHRLQTQAEEFSVFVRDSLQKAGLREGKKVADIGCGTGDVSLVAAELAGSSGSVVGLDANPTAIEQCKKSALAKGAKNVSFRVGDALNTKLPSAEFDIVYSRFLFQHVKDPRKCLKEMTRIAKRPGGMIMVEDCDLHTWLAEPENKYVDQLWSWYESIVKQKGSDPRIGKRLYKLFIEQNLEPKVQVYSLAVLYGNRRMWKTITGVLKKLEDNDRGRELVEGIEEFAAKRDSIFVFPLIFRVWAELK